MGRPPSPGVWLRRCDLNKWIRKAERRDDCAQTRPPVPSTPRRNPIMKAVVLLGLEGGEQQVRRSSGGQRSLAMAVMMVILGKEITDTQTRGTISLCGLGVIQGGEAIPIWHRRSLWRQPRAFLSSKILPRDRFSHIQGRSAVLNYTHRNPRSHFPSRLPCCRNLSHRSGPSSQTS